MKKTENPPPTFNRPPAPPGPPSKTKPTIPNQVEAIDLTNASLDSSWVTRDGQKAIVRRKSDGRTSMRHADGMAFWHYPDGRCIGSFRNRDIIKRGPDIFEMELETATWWPTPEQENPKQRLGRAKFSMSSLPLQVVGEVSVAMTEGARKHGRHNYRVVRITASDYFDATMRHLMAYMEGEDIDPDSGVSHLSKAIASLMVWRDAGMNQTLYDDRPIRPTNRGWCKDLDKLHRQITERIPGTALPETEEGKQ